ncbi:unnamed protein product [Auanema sp. JU1783]|nr:unnamed protein product [Auanema sp. JU1783]
MICFLLLFILQTSFAYSNPHTQKLSFVINEDVPSGWLLADMEDYGIGKIDSLVFQSNGYPITLNTNYQLVTTAPIKGYSGDTFSTFVTDVTNDRVWEFHIFITSRQLGCTHNTYNITVPYSTAQTITVRNPVNVLGKGPGSLKFKVLRTAPGQQTIKVSTSDPNQITINTTVSRLFSKTSHEVFIGVYDRKNSNVHPIAICQIALNFEQTERFFEKTSFILNVHKKGSKSSFVHLQKMVQIPTQWTFVVEPISKNITFDGSTLTVPGSLPSGHHDFHIILYNRMDKIDECFVVMTTTEEAVFSKRGSRNAKEDITWSVKENSAPRILEKKIRLNKGETIVNAPIVSEFLTIHNDGSVELTKRLNYEEVSELVKNIEIEGTRRTGMIVSWESMDTCSVMRNFLWKLFEARDENGDGDSDIAYKLVNTEPPGAFTIDDDGIVRTALSQYNLGSSYRVLVQALDKTPKNDSSNQYSEVAKLEILAADRPPQFLKQRYEVFLPENTLVDSNVVDVRAQRFRPVDDRRSKGPITYSLYTAVSTAANSEKREPSSWFRINPSSGIVYLKRQLDYDDPSQPKLHKLTVVVHEDGKENSVPLDIYLADTNDNAPEFSRPLYTAQVKEDIGIGVTILKVDIEDKDAGPNAEIRFTVDNDNFTINENGEISAIKKLDADQFKERFFIYRFNVTATDAGSPQLSRTATVHIRTENTNDEPPTFLPTDQFSAFVAEDAEGGTPVVQIQARDPDRDQVEYGFVDENGRETQEYGLFQIDKDTGLIKLRTHVQALELLKENSPYKLRVVARDDGSCCSYPSESHAAYAIVVIGIEDVNNNKPEFPDCGRYAEIAKIREGVYKKNPPVIIKVEATDEDSSSNGEIVYSLYYAQTESRKPFIIDKLTGVLTPSPHVIFDRETRPREDVTVKATDRGDRPLIGFCQFSVEVVDVNDNAPQFERASYETSISRSETVGTSVHTVFAFDIDAPHNARVTYHLESDPTAGLEHSEDMSFFEFKHENSGEITLIKEVPKDDQKEKFVFNVIASDNGLPEAQFSTVPVIIKIHERQQVAPRWLSSPDCRDIVTVVENTEVNKVLLSCHAVAGDGSKSSIFYKLTVGGLNRGTKADSKFRLFNKIEDGREWVEVAIMEPLDYEQAQNYTLSLIATDVNSHVSSSRSFTVLVTDVNDVVPQFTVDLFTGTIDEGLTVDDFMRKNNGKAITTVKAQDTDSQGPQSEVHYRILDMPGSDVNKLFRIDELTGEIFPIAEFDRETKDMFILTVEARDNKPSALPGVKGPNKDNVKVQIVIGDVNDNPPFFNGSGYEGHVPENADLGHDIITIKAHDLDKHSNLRYDLTSAHGEKRIPFGVRTDSGVIFVKEPLDYEQNTVYQLKLQVSDGKHNTSTDVFIYVADVNDNAPIFEQTLYSTTVLEEDPHIPKTLFQVRATDADMDETSGKIIYRLEGQGAGEFFQIGKESGVIQLIKILDRDPPNGVPTWKFIVQAIDNNGNGLIGYADVQVVLKDINDNAPMFADDLFGYVEENREPHSNEGVYFMDVRATDFDDPTTDNARLEYSITLNKEIDGEPVFRIDPTSGKIFAMRSLDRELHSEKEFVIEVRATDKGIPPREGSGNVTIKVLDKNDNEPYFERQLYETSVPETARIGSAVISVSALDEDNEAIDNVFTYQLADDSKYFYMTTDRDSSNSYVGVLRVKQSLDYEDSAQKDGFRLRIRVNDGRHDAFSNIAIALLDRNDHAPEIEGPSELSFPEDEPVGSKIAKFTINDRDHEDSNRASPTFANDLSLPFGLDPSLTKSRFSTYVGPKARDIRVFVMKNISEDTSIGTVLDTFKAHDPTMNSFNYTFRINRQSDPKRQFSIDQDGTLKVAQRLDREDIPSYRLIIEAYDAADNVGTQMVAVYLQDVNDNGPEPYTIPKTCIFMENTPVNQMGTCEIRATDRDTGDYGPPFSMQLDTTFKYGNYLSVTFDPNGDGGNGSMTIKPLVEFDREADVPGKVLEVPLVLSDKAGKTNKASVYVVIGDQNDNPMHDGSMTITVNSYLDKLQKTVIGRVYVDDLDDWDLGDKTFTMQQSQPGFSISEHGVITMDANMPPGTYKLSSKVHDNVRNEDAMGYVTVDVVVVPQVAFDNQGSMQLLIAENTNLQYPEDFIRVNSSGTSMMKVFVEKMVGYIGGSVSLDVFSIQLGIATLQNRNVPVLNVRFSAHGSPYKDPALLNGLVSAHREELQSLMGTTIVGVGIDMCKFTMCDAGCQTINSADFEGVVVSANSTVLVGVNTTSKDDCTCPVWNPPSECRAGLCHNDGVCHNTLPGFFCECRNDFLKGMRCQGTTRSFDGSGFAWYKPMPACTSLNISMSFMTVQRDGLIFYNGPMDTKTNDRQIEYRDYIIIQLKNGMVNVEISMNGMIPVTLEVPSISGLNDGKWHTLSVTQNGKHITLVIDDCRDVDSNNSDLYCRHSTSTPDDDERLNIVAPAQLGGLAPLTSGQQYPPTVPKKGLNGCVRNLYVNGDQYDLATPAYEKNSETGCKLWGSACDSNSVDTVSFCVHGDCYANAPGDSPNVPKCICDPGWGGPRCDQQIQWVQFNGGYIDYQPKIGFSNQVNDIELLFIPGRVSSSSAGLAYGTEGQNYVSTSVDAVGDSLVPSSRFNVGTLNNPILRIPEVNLKENGSYWMQLTRNPIKASLSIDGAYFNTLYFDQFSSRNQLNINQILLGRQDGNNAFRGCVGTYRWENHDLPLRKPTNQAVDDSGIVSIERSVGVVDGCSLRITCADLPSGFCSGAFVCMDFWKGPFCTCADGANAILGDDGQVVGCGETLAVAKLGISSPAIILILVSLALLIMLVLLMVVYTRRQPTTFGAVRPEDSNRDNIRTYYVEGGGEADNDAYSIDNLRKPVMPPDGNGLGPVAPPIYGRPVDDRLNSQINDLEGDQNHAPYDELRIYDDEKDNISVVTLESLESASGTASAVKYC